LKEAFFGTLVAALIGASVWRIASVFRLLQ
jgi:hypothetical protein